MDSEWSILSEEFPFTKTLKSSSNYICISFKRLCHKCFLHTIKRTGTINDDVTTVKPHLQEKMVSININLLHIHIIKLVFSSLCTSVKLHISQLSEPPLLPIMHTVFILEERLTKNARISDSILCKMWFNLVIRVFIQNQNSFLYE